jgi:hypothetical protein
MSSGRAGSGDGVGAGCPVRESPVMSPGLPPAASPVQPEGAWKTILTSVTW